MAMGEDLESCGSSSFVEFSEVTESTLVDSKGVSEDAAVGLVIPIAGVVVS